MRSSVVPVAVVDIDNSGWELHKEAELALADSLVVDSDAGQDNYLADTVAGQGTVDIQQGLQDQCKVGQVEGGNCLELGPILVADSLDSAVMLEASLPQFLTQAEPHKEMELMLELVESQPEGLETSPAGSTGCC